MRDLLRRIAADLAAATARFAVVGGHAVSARTQPRFTRDIDLAVAVAEDRQAEGLIGGLLPRGYRVVAILEQEGTGRLATVRLEHVSASAVVVDLLFATAGIEPEVVAGATPLQLLDGVVLPVASVGHLLALKTLSTDDSKRPQDRVDIGALLRVATAADLRVAEEAMTVMTQRGCNRGRDLLGMFAQLRAAAE